eukprot:gene8801-18209_t
MSQITHQEQVMPDDGRGLPRKLTAIGTVGDVGQLFTVYEKNWKCSDCNQENYASRTRCFRCRAQKPDGLQNYVMDPAVEALQTGGIIDWQEVIDPTTYQMYYYNKVTGATQWERPAEMGPAPHATGWFGRGKSGSVAAKMYMEKNLKYLQRQARKQKDFIDPKKYHLEGADEYNIWYGRHLGDHWDQGAGREAAESRCILEKDAGATKADLQGSKKDKKFFCLHFARGACAKGVDCSFFHRIPTPEDDANTDELVDCFGRQRHNKHRDDMNGVGSFMKPCRTLFVGGLIKQKYDTPQKLEEALWKHFGEWGELENVNVIFRLAICFIRYRLRTSTEFAKEAMTNQALDHSEILSLRWAHDDPNPVAQDSIARADKDALYALLSAKGFSLKDVGYEYPAEYQLPDAKKMRLENGADPIAQHPELAYPDTDQQYISQQQQQQPLVQNQNQYTPEQLQQYYAMYQQYYAQFPTGTDSSTPAAAGAGAGGESNNVINTSSTSLISDKDDNNSNSNENGLTNEWTEVVDETTGATYYYNSVSGESSWSAPASTSS